MKIGIIGAGNVGTALAKRLAPQGHEIVLTYSRDAEKLRQSAESLGAGHGLPEDLRDWADVIVLTVPWGAVPDAIGQAGNLHGKVLWDCTNPLLPDYSGLVIGTTTSGGEEVSRLAPGAKVIKGIPPMAQLLHADDPTVNGKAVDLFVAGDDAEAKAVVTQLLTALPGNVIDAGDLAASRVIEPAMLLLVRLAYALGHGPRVSLRFDKDGRS